MDHSIDIEITNRCNAKCHFCPRDQTPHQGLMSEETFDKALERAIEYRALAADLLGAKTTVSLCGLGEPLLHPKAVEFVRRVKAAGFYCQMSSNAGLLTKEKGEALVEAGLDEILINAGDRNEEYEEVYKLPFQRTDDNVRQFIKTAKDRCIVSLVLVDHHQDERHLFEMEYFWRKRGVKRFFTYGVINRGGALFVDHMQYERMPQLARAQAIFEEEGVTPRCGAPFGYLFVGYDAEYYLCCSDWKKEAPMGTVFDHSFQEVIRAKLEHVTSRMPVCRTCNLDPVNMLTEELAALDAGNTTQEKVDEVLTGLLSSSTHVVEVSKKLGVDPGDLPKPNRRLIPVWSE